VGDGGEFVVDQASRADPKAGPGVYAPYGPLYMYTLVTLYRTYMHMGRSLVVSEDQLHEGREQARKVVHLFMLLTVQLMIAGMTSIMTELGSGGVTCTGCPRNAQRLF
jgi:hypothetical protein